MTTILLVEDEVKQAKVIQQELEGHGYTVIHAADGLTALRLCEQQRPDLVVLDWMITALDGLEVLRRLRRDLPTPVLMLTSRVEETDQVIGLELGADDYMTKPFSMRELVARVRALLRRAERIQQIVDLDRTRSVGAMGYRNLMLDPSQRLALIDGEPLTLTLIEFGLLDLLLRNPGRVFSRAYLLETIWERPYVEGDRSVDNAVMRLRRKLGDLGVNIEAVLGAGYRLRRIGK